MSDTVIFGERLVNEEEKRPDIYLLAIIPAFLAGGGVALGTRQRQERQDRLPRVEGTQKYFKGGRGFFVMVPVVNQKARFVINHTNNLYTITMHLLLSLYTDLLYKQYLRREIDVLDKDHVMFVLKKPHHISKDFKFTTLTISIGYKNLIIRVSKRNKFLKYENVPRIYASLRRSSKHYLKILEYLSVKPGTRDHNTVNYIHTTVFLISNSDDLA